MCDLNIKQYTKYKNIWEILIFYINKLMKSSKHLPECFQETPTSL